ncbi:MAG: ImmA/IrrE family metallo-endopeptidase [Methylococcales bacterium]|jgi:Zn-dependent peptidase ImmA (M78 family)|nr:ImmA/IrrE family metallo-endopeptidase [Methylococcales bacterium]
MSDKKFPQKEAIRINRLLDTVPLPPGIDRFPVDVAMVAQDLTPSFNEDPITAVKGEKMGSSVDGMLVKHSFRNEWAIFYNTDVIHPGRSNFTLAHELGHYMVHRQSLNKTKFQCGEKDMLDENLQGIDIETEANAFAANLLMPNSDFRTQADGQKFSIDLMQHCANRYGVSLTAAVLKWLDFTKKRAIGLLSEEGFMHWSKSSNRAFRSGRYFATKKNCVEVPEFSLAAEEQYSAAARNGVRHGPDIWFPGEEVMEYSIYSEEYGKTLTVLILDDSGGYSDPNGFNEDDELLTDSYTNFINNGQDPY